LAPLAPIGNKALHHKTMPSPVPIAPQESPEPKGLARLFRRRDT
jgi:hypothetical protein